MFYVYIYIYIKTCFSSHFSLKKLSWGYLGGWITNGIKKRNTFDDSVSHSADTFENSLQVYKFYLL